MAKVSSMPPQEVIDGFHGVVDFYYWCDMAIARKWPATPKLPRSSPVLNSARMFAYINQQAYTIDQTSQDFLKVMALGQKMTWKDWLTSLYISGQKYMNPQP